MSNSVIDRVDDLIEEIDRSVTKSVVEKRGTLQSLNTNDKSNLIAAINEVLSVAQASSADGALLEINRLSEFDTPQKKIDARENLELQNIDLGTFN